MIEDLSKFEALWSEIRQSQYLTEENIKKIDNLLKELKELEKSNSSHIANITKLYEITNKLLLNLQAINKNFNENVENLNNSVNELVYSIKKAIEDSVNNIDVSNIEYAIKAELKNLKNELIRETNEINEKLKSNLDKQNKKLMNTASDFKLLSEDLSITKNKIKSAINELNKTRKNLNNQIKSVNFKWIALALGLGLAGGILASQAITQYYVNKYQITLIKERIIKKANNKIQQIAQENNELQEQLQQIQKQNNLLQQQIKKLKDKNEYLANIFNKVKKYLVKKDNELYLKIICKTKDYKKEEYGYWGEERIKANCLIPLDQNQEE